MGLALVCMFHLKDWHPIQGFTCASWDWLQVLNWTSGYGKWIDVAHKTSFDVWVFFTSILGQRGDIIKQNTTAFGNIIC